MDRWEWRLGEQCQLLMVHVVGREAADIKVELGRTLVPTEV